MTDQTRDEVTRYDRLTPAARTLLENHDELDLAEMLAQANAERNEARLRAVNAYGQRDRLRARIAAVAERWQLPGHISMPQAAADIEEALDQEAWAPWPDPMRQVLDTCDQLRRAAVLADGRPHTDRERGIVHAVDRILDAINRPGPAATEATDGMCSPDAPEIEPNNPAVTALYEQWVKAGPPPLGTLIARWWDKRLAELGRVLEQSARTIANNPAVSSDMPARRIQVTARHPDESTVNRFALSLGDHIRAEFGDSIRMDITTDAKEQP